MPLSQTCEESGAQSSAARSYGLKELLYSDLARQYELEGRPDLRPNFLRFLARLLHFRFLPNVIFRTSRAAMLAGIPLLPGLLTYLNLVLFGVEITPRCEIGPGFFLPHPVGCVIGAWRIGSNVTMFGGVGLGAINDIHFTRELRCQIGSNVILGTGCKVMGPLLHRRQCEGWRQFRGNVFHRGQSDGGWRSCPACPLETRVVQHD